MLRRGLRWIHGGRLLAWLPLPLAFILCTWVEDIISIASFVAMPIATGLITASDTPIRLSEAIWTCVVMWCTKASLFWAVGTSTLSRIWPSEQFCSELVSYRAMEAVWRLPFSHTYITVASFSIHCNSLIVIVAAIGHELFSLFSTFAL